MNHFALPAVLVARGRVINFGTWSNVYIASPDTCPEIIPPTTVMISPFSSDSSLPIKLFSRRRGWPYRRQLTFRLPSEKERESDSSANVWRD